MKGMIEHKEWFKNNNRCPCSENGDSCMDFSAGCDGCEIWDDETIDHPTSKVVE